MPESYTYIYELIREIDDRGVGLTDWEIKFIGSLVDKPSRYLSDKQIEIIKRIHSQKVPS